MTHMIADLLDFTSIQAARLKLEPRQCVASELVRDAVDVYAALAAEKGVRLENATTELLDVRLTCDPNRIVQVLSNLLGNAVKFTPTDGVVKVDASVSGDGRGLTFCVRDSGPGIAAEDLPHVFDRYYQARRRAREGVGLGLAIVKGIVEAHGGTVHASSSPGAGSAFSFTLPLAPA
jgi:signal transduction histidine kinase